MVPTPADPRADHWSDAELLHRMRARDEVAVRELFERFSPMLLREARRLRVQPGLRRELVCDVLRAVFDALAHGDRDPPASLGAYAMRALHRRIVLVERQLRASHEILEEAFAVVDDDSDESRETGTSLARLADGMMAALTVEERWILRWLAEHVPQREIADWCGVSYATMRVRVLRLRRKAALLAQHWIATRPTAERRRLERLIGEVAEPASPSAGPCRAARPGKTAATSSGDTDDAAP